MTRWPNESAVLLFEHPARIISEVQGSEKILVSERPRPEWSAPEEGAATPVSAIGKGRGLAGGQYARMSMAYGGLRSAFHAGFPIDRDGRDSPVASVVYGPERNPKP